MTTEIPSATETQLDPKNAPALIWEAGDLTEVTNYVNARSLSSAAARPRLRDSA